uniref:Tachykinin n=1 Tax=Glossina brevipalpis TaxID=37001 RepID=A0A1A9WJE6_9MUSC
MAKKQLSLAFFHRLSFTIILWLLLRSNNSVRAISSSAIQNGNALKISPEEQVFEKIIENVPKGIEVEEDDKNIDNKIDESQKQFIADYGYYVNNVKRAPSGFMGMRGKKLFSEQDEETTNAYKYPQMRNDQRYKKAPTAFYGVRGKKFTDDLKRWKDLLQKIEAEQIQEILLKEFLEDLMGIDEKNNELMIKRAPNGFTGVRGKRPDFQKNRKQQKFAIKSFGIVNNNDFIGARGKRSFLMYHPIKRSRQRNFFDFWKKSSYDGGKRQRFVGFGNKFVAVRGKKSSYPNIKKGELTRQTSTLLTTNSSSFWLPNLDDNNNNNNGKTLPNASLETNGNMVGLQMILIIIHFFFQYNK